MGCNCIYIEEVEVQETYEVTNEKINR